MSHNNAFSCQMVYPCCFTFLWLMNALLNKFNIYMLHLVSIIYTHPLKCLYSKHKAPHHSCPVFFNVFRAKRVGALNASSFHVFSITCGTCLAMDHYFTFK